VYSLVLTLYEILVGKAVFERIGDRPFMMLPKITNGEMALIPETILPYVKSLIQQRWSVDPKRGPSFKEIFEFLHKHGFQIIEGGKTSEIDSFVQSVR
jgi:hypothetical protein